MYYESQKNTKVFYYGFLQQERSNMQETADLATFNEIILNGKLQLVRSNRHRTIVLLQLNVVINI